MRFVTFLRKNERRLGLMGPQEHIIDLAELNRRYLKGGSLPFLTSMQGFIEAGAKATQVARKAEKYVAGKNADELRKIASCSASTIESMSMKAHAHVRLKSNIPSGRFFLPSRQPR